MKTKNIISTLSLLLLMTIAYAQQGINYKAIIHDSSGDPITNTAITVQFTILENGTINVYQEIHYPTTDANGIINVNIGEGTLLSGDFNAIDWGSNPHFLKTEIGVGEGLIDMGTTMFQAVPYAIHAETAFEKGNPGAVLVFDGYNYIPTQFSFYFADGDNDGFGSGVPGLYSPVYAPHQPDNYVINSDDCDDQNDQIYPGAGENCEDGIDNDCDGLTDCEDNDCIEFPGCGLVDILLLFDTSGDMGGAIDNIKSSMSTVLSTLSYSISDMAVGVSDFQDFPIDPYGSAGNYPYRLVQSITTNLTSVLSAISLLDTEGGGDILESGHEAIYQLVTGEGLSYPGGAIPAGQNIGFRDNSRRILVVISSAEFHNNDYTFPTHSFYSALDALTVQGVSQVSVSVGNNPGYNDLVTYATETGAIIAPEPQGCPTGISGAYEDPIGGVCPLVLKANSDGAGIGQHIVNGILALLAE